MDHTITLRKAGGTWTLRAGGAVLAESTKALELTEPNAPTQIYFPYSDIAMAFLEPSDHTTHCDHKGTAHYLSIITKSTKLSNVLFAVSTNSGCSEKSPTAVPNIKS